jgi:hypothetical protein
VGKREGDQPGAERRGHHLESSRLPVIDIQDSALTVAGQSSVEDPSRQIQIEKFIPELSLRVVLP